MHREEMTTPHISKMNMHLDVYRLTESGLDICNFVTLNIFYVKCQVRWRFKDNSEDSVFISELKTAER